MDDGQDGSAGADLLARAKPGRWLLVAAVGLFVLYALNFLYLFVDDEGIPFVYAQHLLRHQGFVYSILEGPTEGYSDFLHVVLATGILGGVRALGWPKITVFLVGQAISLAAGVGIVATVSLSPCAGRPWFAARRHRRPGVRGPLGPRGVMELLVARSRARSHFSSPASRARSSPARRIARRRGSIALAAAAAALVVLERIDGPIYAAAVIGSFWICADRERRRAIARRVVAPVVLLTIGLSRVARLVLPEPVAVAGVFEGDLQALVRRATCS